MARKTRPRIVTDAPEPLDPSGEGPTDATATEPAEPEVTPDATADEPPPDPTPDPEPDPEPPTAVEPAEEPAEEPARKARPRPQYVAGKGWTERQEAPKETAPPAQEARIPRPRKKRGAKSKETREERSDRWAQKKREIGKGAKQLAPLLEAPMRGGLLILGRIMTGKPDDGLASVPVALPCYDESGEPTIEVLPMGKALARNAAEIGCVFNLDILNHPIVLPIMAAVGLGGAIGKAMFLGSEVYTDMLRREAENIRAAQEQASPEPRKPNLRIVVSKAPDPDAPDHAS